MHFRIGLPLLLSAGLAFAQLPKRPDADLAIGDLVEDASHMKQIVEVASAPDMTGYINVVLPHVGTTPVHFEKVRLLARGDTPPRGVTAPGDLAAFSHMNRTERGLILRAVGGFREIKTDVITIWMEVEHLRVVKPQVVQVPTNTPGKFSRGDSVQVRVGDFWLPGAIAGYNPDTNWYSVSYQNGGALYRGWASPVVLRKAPGAASAASAANAPPSPPSPPGAPPPNAAPQPPPVTVAIEPRNPFVCGNQPYCSEVNSFAATLTDFRTTVAGRDRLLTATVRFRNKNAHPLILAFVPDSGVALDDQGNRFITYGEAAVRGIGLVSRGSADTKFTLQPGETSDARFELLWRPATGREIIGTSYTLDLVLREIQLLPANQVQLGREHAIRFAGLGGKLVSSGSANPTHAVPATAAPVSAAAATPAPAVEPLPDACAGKPRCFSAGPFVAEIAQLNASQPPRQHRVLRFNVKFRNLTPQPVILAYMPTTSSAVDNQGNQFYWGGAGTHDTSATGIGYVARGSINTQFALAPGESRNAQFQLYRKPDNTVIGTSFTWSVSIAQVEILSNGQQVRTVREYSLNFPDLVASAGAIPSSSGSTSTSLNSAIEASKQIGDLFRKKK